MYRNCSVREKICRTYLRTYERNDIRGTVHDGSKNKYTTKKYGSERY